MVNNIESTTLKQFPFPVDVRYNITVPFAISEGVGVYVAFNVVLFGAKAPNPPDH